MDSHHRLTELAVEAGRSLLSDETDWVHSGDLIPIVDNGLYALALLRQRTKDSVQEAKLRLERLLPFQTEEGLFPSSIHEYPQGNPRSPSLLLPLFALVLQGYGHVVGKALASDLQEAARRLYAAWEGEALKGHAAAYLLGLREQSPEEREVNGRRAVADALLAEQLLEVEWPSLRRHLSEKVHAPTQLYCGALRGECQAGVEPALSLLDFQLAALSGHFPKRLLTPSRIHLQAALVHPFSWRASFSDTSPWMAAEGDFFRLTWGSAEAVRTLVITGVEKITKEANEWLLELGEAHLYFPLIPELQFTVNGGKATLFHMEERVEVVDGSTRIVLQFQGEEGTGHIHRGNRPGQLLASGEERFNAYDWHLFIRGATSSKLKLRIDQVVI